MPAATQDERLLLQAVLAMRFGAIALVGGWAVTMVVMRAEPWRLIPVALIAAIVAVTVKQARTGRLTDTSALLHRVVVGQTLIVVATGGLHSPLCSVLMITAVVSGVVRRSGTGAIPVSVTALAALTLLAAAELFTPGLRPAFFDDTGPLFLPLAHAGTIGVLIIVGAGVGQGASAAIQRGHAEAATFQTEALEAMSARNRDLVSMTGAIAHELKNPLSAILGLSTLLAEDVDRETPAAAQVDVLVGEVRRTTRIVEDFLNIARPLNPAGLERVGLGAVVDGVLALHRGLAAEKALTLRREGVELDVRCDGRKVRHIVMNLLQNAIEASPDGGAVSVRLEADGRNARLVVRDHGPGLAPEMVGAAFVPGVTSRGTGSGLGLPVAQSLATAHGGRIELANAPDGGCEATLVLPLGGPAAEAPS